MSRRPDRVCLGLLGDPFHPACALHRGSRLCPRRLGPSVATGNEYECASSSQANPNSTNHARAVARLVPALARRSITRIGRKAAASPPAIATDCQGSQSRTSKVSARDSVAAQVCRTGSRSSGVDWGIVRHPRSAEVGRGLSGLGLGSVQSAALGHASRRGPRGSGRNWLSERPTWRAHCPPNARVGKLGAGPSLGCAGASVRRG